MEITTETPVTATNRGRVRQLIVTIFLSIMLTVGLIAFLMYGGVENEATDTVVWIAFVVGQVLLGINYVNDNVLLRLVERFPIPKKLLNMAGKE